MITEDIRKQLRAPFPSEAISQHPTKTFLSTIKAIYVTERLNDVFGIGGWNVEHKIMSDSEDYVTVEGRIIYGLDEDKERFLRATPYQYGGHKKTGTNTEPADGYKSAVTDCISKCASYLEIGIDVFKGKVSPGKPKDNDMSTKQWNFIKKLGADIGMTEPDVILMVKWVAEQNNFAPRSYKVAKLMLPEENFAEQLKLYSEANIMETMPETKPEPILGHEKENEGVSKGKIDEPDDVPF